MATYSNNTTIKVLSSVNSGQTGNTPTTTNTPGSSQYSVLTALIDNATSSGNMTYTITIGGNLIARGTIATGAAPVTTGPFYVGPSAAAVIATAGGNGGGNIVSWVGVTFANTP